MRTRDSTVQDKRAMFEDKKPGPEPPQETPVDRHPPRRVTIRRRVTTETMKTKYLKHIAALSNLASRDPVAFMKAVKEVELELLDGQGSDYDNRGIRRLFNNWVADDYDGHMAGTGHDRAVEIILRQLAEVSRLKIRDGTPIFGDRLIELACGTGTPIKLLSEILPPEYFKRMKITANDVAQGMRDTAGMKLIGMDNISYTDRDICQDLTFARKRYDTAVLSQTLPFIADPRLLAEENEQGMPLEFRDHVDMKATVFRGIFDHVLKEYGYLVLVDEWPATLSEGSRDPISDIRQQMNELSDSNPDLIQGILRRAAIRREFFRYFRPIERSRLYGIFRNNICGARFVCEVKIAIDGRHSMYGMVYMLDPDKLMHRGHLLSLAKRNDDLRDAAVERLLETVTVTDRYFTANNRPPNSDTEKWVRFTPIDAENVFDSREGKSLTPDARYDTVMLVDMLHEMPSEKRQALIKTAVTSLKKGGALVVIDEWGIPKSAPHPVSKTEWREVDLIPVRDRLMFQASFREPIADEHDSAKYCYVFRKVSDVPVL